MTTFKEYLKEKALFFSPQPEGDNTSCTDVSNVEANRLDRRWKPVAAWLDNQMVESLLTTVDNYLEDRPLPVEQSELDCMFQPRIDKDGRSAVWIKNFNEAHARSMVSQGALAALWQVMEGLGLPLSVDLDVVPPASDFASKVDFALTTGEGKKVLVEIKSTSVLDNALHILQLRGFRINLRSQLDMGVRVINIICLYMASHRVHWAALTSHEKWVFFRLHPKTDENDPYVSFSTVERQENNTRPFRALLGMLIATTLQLDVKSQVDKTVLVTIPEDDVGADEKDEPEVDPNEDKSGAYRGSSKGGDRAEKPVTRSAGRGALMQTTESPNLLISWSHDVVKDSLWLALDEVGNTGQELSLGTGTVRLFLRRMIGSGLTGVVYEATSAIDDHGRSSSYAIKTLAKGSIKDEELSVKHFRKEFRVYCEIERAKRNGEILPYVTPCCYGFYESDSMMALVMDYEGKALTDVEWRALSRRDKAQILELIAALHKIGIVHNDIEARNIVRGPSGSFKIIDFAMSSFHQCTGIKEVPWYKGSRHNECAELRYMWDQLSAER